jgi:hypothetical protein
MRTKFLLNLSFIIITARKVRVFVLNIYTNLIQFFGGLSMFLVCIYSNFKCYHKLNPRAVQLQMIWGGFYRNGKALHGVHTSQYQKIWEPPIFTTIHRRLHYCWWSYDKMFFHSSLLSNTLSHVPVCTPSLAFLLPSLIAYLHPWLGLPIGH